ncbi:MAG: amino-acid N-acetyltransferase [Verrucomicrobiota bacterium]|nr:amino-acid N-acetyltransferase [Verrucomicrobiota bacterium]
MKVTDLRGILTYVPNFREKVFVIALDGEIIESENFANLLLDLAVLRSLNIRIILVHGAGYQIRKLAAQTSEKISNDDGTGITDETTLKLALLAANRLTHEMMEGLTNSDLRASYINAVIASPYGIIGGVDHLFTGKVERIDVEFLNALLEKGAVPVVPPLGFDGEGHTFRVNSDAIALSIAISLKAAKLIFITTSEGLPKNGDIVRQLGVLEAEEYLKKNKSDVPRELISKLVHSIKACHEGVPRAHIINGRLDEALLTEIFSHEGVGTMIYANEYQAIRRALKKDVTAIVGGIQKSVQNDELVKRSRQSVISQLQDYFVFEVDKSVVGCVALHQYPAQSTAELACLYVSPSFENRGIGRKLITYVENLARERGFRRLIALSSQAFTYFQRKAGFNHGSIDDLPPERRVKHDQSRRNSIILIKDLEQTDPQKVTSLSS